MILIVGGTGNVGRHVVEGLAAQGKRPRVLTRDVEHARAVLGATTDVIQGDLQDKTSIEVALAGVSRVFLATPSNENQVAQETSLIDAAARTGIKHLVKLSGGLAAYPEQNLFGKYHAEIEAHLASSPLAWTVLRPNWFAQNFLGEAQSIAQGAIYGAASDGRIAFVDVRDVAAVAVKVLTEDGHAGRIYRISGPQALTFSEAARAIGTGIGRNVDYVDLPEPAYHEALVKLGLPQPIIDLVTAGYRSARAGLFDGVDTSVLDVTGKGARSLETFARDHASTFRPAA